MKPLRLQSMTVVLACVLGFSGCAQKKPVLVAPQQLPPTTAPQPTPTPEPTAESQPAEQPQETQQPATNSDQTTKAAEKAKPKDNHHPAAKKPAGPASTGKIVIQADRTNAPVAPAGGQISPGPTPADAAHSQTSTEQLLQSTENNLNSIKRQLSKDEEAMRAQIREFMNQSRKATAEDDLARAHNFALKARLLSDELAKPQ